jgi:NitT/TauT family transport system substrate-binding protein
MGFADVNSLITFRDQKSWCPIKAVVMVYNRPPFAIVTGKSRGVKTSKARSSAQPPPTRLFAQWRIFVEANGIDASKVAIENVGIPIREPMLAAGQLDAITGLSFSCSVNLKDRGVAIDDVVVSHDGRLRRRCVRKCHHREPEIRDRPS